MARNREYCVTVCSFYLKRITEEVVRWRLYVHLDLSSEKELIILIISSKVINIRFIIGSRDAGSTKTVPLVPN